MKKDVNLIRSILLNAEASDEEFDCNNLVSSDGDLTTIAYHVELLQEAGFVRANCQYAMGHEAVMVTVESITGNGYDFLDTIRSNQVGAKANKAIKKSVGDTSLSVIKEICTKVAIGLIQANL